MKSESELAKKNVELGFEFSRYLLAHPEIEEKIPENALVVFEVEDDPELSRYNRVLSHRTRSPNQSIILVHIKGLAPTRLLEPEVTAPT